MIDTFRIKLLDIQPSQLFISEAKLSKVREWLNEDHIEGYDPIPVKKLNGKVVFTDGHTRAYALHQLGVESLHVYWDNDNLDWEAYQICVAWCVEEGITNISNLLHRVVENNLYEELWLSRCKAMHSELEASRKRIDK